MTPENGYCEKVIHNRIAQNRTEKKIFMNKKKTVYRQMKLGLEETNYKVSSLERSTVRCRDVDADRSRLEDFEMWIWRMEKISTKDKRDK